MFEVNQNADHPKQWLTALDGDHEILDTMLADYQAAVDWPAALFWPELMAANPDAIVVLSHRGDAQTWWNSVDKTVWAAMRSPTMTPEFIEFSSKMRRQAALGDDWDTPEAAMAYYDRVYEEVIAAVPAERLVIWQASQGWEPLCHALGVAVPDHDFFHHNTTAEFRERAGFDTN